jgi:hypothetical protein
MQHIRLSWLLAVLSTSWVACSSHHDSDGASPSTASAGRSARGGSGGQTANAGRSAAGGGGGTSAAAGSAATVAPAMPVRCRTPDCQLECAQSGGCRLDCGANCNFSTSNRAPIPSLDVNCGANCEGECGRGVQSCNVKCSGDCVIECESVTCNIQCNAGSARPCPDGEAYVCGAGACEEEDEEGDDAGV